jgi:hypothetical protein
MKRFKIDSEQIFYVDRGRGETSKFCKESSAIIREALRVLKLPTDATILTDAGSCYQHNKQDVIKQCGYSKHFTYPPSVHQYLSINDNNIHRLKVQWRRDHEDSQDDVVNSLDLMHRFENVPATDILECTNRNFIVHEKSPTVEDCKELIGKSPVEESDFYDVCLSLYEAEFVETLEA